MLNNLSTIKPPLLHQGDLIAIISPSNTIAHRKTTAEKALKKFEEMTGLKAIFAPNAFAQHYYSAGTSKQRIDDFHWALQNPEVKGIMFSVGGKTAIDIVPHLNYELIRKNPKVITGISDATTLLNPILSKSGLITFLGTEFLQFATNEFPYQSALMKQGWFNGELGCIKQNPRWKNFEDLQTSYSGWEEIRKGKVEGLLIGGNANGFIQLLLTEYSPPLDKNILILETYLLEKRAIHMLLMQLRLRGVFNKIGGLIIGYCHGSDDPTKVGNERSMKDLVLEVTDGYNFPVLQIGEIGHHVENIMVPIGARALIDTSEMRFEILEKVVH